MLLSFTGTRFVATQLTPPEQAEVKAAGFHHQYKGNVWWTGLLSLAKQFEQFADKKAKERFSREDTQISLSKALNSNVMILAPQGLEYLPFQKAGIAYALPRPNTLIADEMGLGKEQPLDALVLTPSGFKKMGELVLGEEVIGSDGKPHLIEVIIPQGLKRINTVTLNDGTSTECGEDHLWTTFSSDYKTSKKNWKVRKTSDIRTTLCYKLPTSGRKANLRHYIPIVDPVEFSVQQTLPLDPYALGYILGNGSLSNEVTAQLCIPDQETVDRIKLLLPVELHHSHDFDYNLCNSTKGGVHNPLTTILRDLNLMGKKAEEKFVPDSYLYSSINSREELIRGLLDSDGYNSGNVIQFYTSSKKLCDDFLFLIQSVGCVGYYSYNPSPSFTYKGEKKIGQPCHTITVNPRPGFLPFKLSRKAKLRRKYTASRAIKAIDYAGEKECQCIRIDSPDGLYITNDFIVTHNSIEAIGVINADPAIRNILLICPASLKLNWSRELMKWAVRKYTGAFATSKELPDTEIVIANYEIIAKIRKLIDKRKWDLLICDEAHYLKGDSKRAKAVLGSEWHGKQNSPPIEATRRLFLTGTPILNKPIELWNMLRVCDPEGLGASHWNYVKRHCGAWDAPWGWDFSGASNLEELNARLRSHFMIRRLKSDVLKDLPPKRRQIIPIQGEAVKAIVQKERDFYEANQEDMETAILMAEKAQAEGDEESYKAAADELKAIKSVSFQEMAALRRDTAIAKIPFVIECLEDALENENKVVVFAHHHEVIRQIAEKFGPKAVQMHGKMNPIEKQRSVDRFQTDPKVNLFIGGITLAVGYTLTIASLAIFCEIDWVPGVLVQAEDRLHRIGQVNPVLIQHLVFDESLDAVMIKRIIKKQEMIEKALDEPKLVTI